MKKPLLLAALATLAACAEPGPPPSTLSLRAVGFETLAAWPQEDFVSLLPVLRGQCRRLGQLPPETALGGDASIPYGRQVADWSGACDGLETVGARPDDVRIYFQTWFQPYEIGTPAFYTGYFEPQVQASLTRGGVYQTPVYGRPRDLVLARASDGKMVSGRSIDGHFAPYLDRAAIDGGALAGKGLEIAWLKSPVDLFFLQIQGSGRLLLPDGAEIRVGYDGRNGQPYVPLGRVLVQEGALPANGVSMDSIRAWLEAHPDRMMAMMERNPNYVFFKRSDATLAQGPTGAFGTPLTAGRSVAIDRHVVPFAMPLWVETKLPYTPGRPTAWDHLVFAQDVGTDIRGAGRADLFTGWGATAQTLAGNLHESGRMILLLPRPPQTPESGASSPDVGSSESASTSPAANDRAQ